MSKSSSHGKVEVRLLPSSRWELSLVFLAAKSFASDLQGSPGLLTPLEQPLGSLKIAPPHPPEGHDPRDCVTAKAPPHKELGRVELSQSFEYYWCRHFVAVYSY